MTIDILVIILVFTLGVALAFWGTSKMFRDSKLFLMSKKEYEDEITERRTLRKKIATYKKELLSNGKVYPILEESSSYSNILYAEAEIEYKGFSIDITPNNMFVLAEYLYSKPAFLEHYISLDFSLSTKFPDEGAFLQLDLYDGIDVTEIKLNDRIEYNFKTGIISIINKEDK